MTIARPFGYNPNHYPVVGAKIVGDLSVATGFYSIDFYSISGITWGMGPNEDISGYIIAGPYVPELIPQFWRSKYKTDESFLDLLKRNFKQNFSNCSDAIIWLNNNNYWTNFVIESFINLEDNDYIITETGDYLIQDIQV